ncbi:MAG: hypothetical protein AAF481_20075 [Acidobacteriota bacterium]
MKLSRLSLLLILLTALISLPALAEDAGNCLINALADDPAMTATELEPLTEAEFLAAIKPEAPRSKVSLLRPSGEGNAFCEWYDIDCGNGTTDECCGSQSSCGSYCAEVCGQECEYVEE